MKHLFQLVLVTLQCRDMLQMLKADQDLKYKLQDTLVVSNSGQPYLPFPTQLSSENMSKLCSYRDAISQGQELP